MEAEETARWFKRYGYLDVSYEHILQYVKGHLEYGTIEVIRDRNNQIIAMGRYNINGDTAHILDCLVIKHLRFRKLIKLMVLRGLKKFPNVTHIEYERELYKDPKKRRLNVMRFLNIREELCLQP